MRDTERLDYILEWSAGGNDRLPFSGPASPDRACWAISETLRSIVAREFPGRPCYVPEDEVIPYERSLGGSRWLPGER